MKVVFLHDCPGCNNTYCRDRRKPENTTAICGAHPLLRVPELRRSTKKRSLGRPRPCCTCCSGACMQLRNKGRRISCSGSGRSVAKESRTSMKRAQWLSRQRAATFPRAVHIYRTRGSIYAVDMLSQGFHCDGPHKRPACKRARRYQKLHLCFTIFFSFFGQLSITRNDFTRCVSTRLQNFHFL